MTFPKEVVGRVTQLEKFGLQEMKQRVLIHELEAFIIMRDKNTSSQSIHLFSICF